LRGCRLDPGRELDVQAVDDLLVLGEGGEELVEGDLHGAEVLSRGGLGDRAEVLGDRGLLGEVGAELGAEVF
jgi:hypothetical protein